MLTKEEFSRVMGWEWKEKCQSSCKKNRDAIYSLDSGVDKDLDKKITWKEFLRAVTSKRRREKGVMVEIRFVMALVR